MTAMLPLCHATSDKAERPSRCPKACPACLDGLQLVLQHAPEALVKAVLLARDHKGVGLQSSPSLLQVLCFGQNGVSAHSWTWLRMMTIRHGRLLVESGYVAALSWGAERFCRAEVIEGALWQAAAVL